MCKNTPQGVRIDQIVCYGTPLGVGVLTLHCVGINQIEFKYISGCKKSLNISLDVKVLSSVLG